MIADDDLGSLIQAVTPVSEEDLKKAGERLDSLTKPRGSLGYLESLAARYSAIRRETRPVVGRKRVVIFVGDHGVVQEGVSAYPQSVTGLMVKNFIGGGAAINVLARQAGAHVEVVDVGMADDPGVLPGLISANVRRGTRNMACGPAMTLDEALSALGVGARRAEMAAEEGVTLLAIGEMGIGNTTPASALFSVLCRLPVSSVTGPGTGLTAEGVARKKEVLKRALAVNRRACSGTLETLAAVGGLEIAAMAGLCIGAAARRIAVVVDGFISSAGALVAMKLCPPVRDYLFFAHQSVEPGHRRFFASEKLRPILDLDMRLGEGSGAALAMQIIQNAVAIQREMATFQDAGIAPGA